MSWFRRTVGLDGLDVLIHAGVTVMLTIFVDMTGGPEEVFPVIIAGSLVVLAVRRRLALKYGTRVGLSTEEMTAERLAELEARVADLEALQARVVELEERMDFSERLLASGPPRSTQEERR